MKTSTMALPIAGLLLAGCATQKYTIDQWRGAMDHSFPNTQPQRFERALQTAFELSRPGEYTLRPHGDGLIAERHWFEYAVLSYAQGTEHWDISYKSDGQNLIARADVVNLPGVNLPLVSASIPDRPDSPSTYGLLWARVAFLLGQRNDWLTCDEYREQLAPHSIDRVQELGLCGVGSEDPPTPKPI